MGSLTTPGRNFIRRHPCFMGPHTSVLLLAIWFLLRRSAAKSAAPNFDGHGLA